MKKIGTLLLCLFLLLPQVVYAQTAETQTEEIQLRFEGKTIACRPISLTETGDGFYTLILHIEGQEAFAKSQKYQTMSPIYACILSEEGDPLMPRQLGWSQEVPDCCYFRYEEEVMPESLMLIPIDAVSDSGRWETLTVADIPTETPEAYQYPEGTWE